MSGALSVGILFRGVKNVYRSRLRTVALLVLLALSVGIFAGFRQATAAVASQSQQLTSVIGNTVEIRNAGASGMGAGAELLPEREFDEIATLPGVVAIEKQLLVRNVFSQFFPSISIAVGNEPGKPLRVATHGEPSAVRIVEGRNLTAGDAGRAVAVAGRLFAENRGLSVGDRWLMEGSQENPAVSPEAVEIVGIFSSDFSFGDNQIFLPLDTAQRIFGMADQITVVWVSVRAVGDVDATVERLRASLPDRDVLSGGSKVRYISAAFDRVVVSGRIWLVLSGVLAGVVVLFTMILATQERTREIGVLKAVGGSNAQIAAQFVVESLTLSLLGSLAGLALFLPLGLVVVNRVLGIADVSDAPAITEMGQAPLNSLLDVDYGMTLETVALVLGLVVSLAVVGSLYPVIRAVSIRPAEALTHG